MTATIQKWGNSLAVRLPKALADEARMREGAKVELVSTPEGVLVKSKRKPKPRYRLSALLAGITAHNVHPETDWGPSVGKEIVAR
jgi:antitoxin MazE